MKRKGQLHEELGLVLLHDFTERKKEVMKDREVWQLDIDPCPLCQPREIYFLQIYLEFGEGHRQIGIRRGSDPSYKILLQFCCMAI